VSVLLAVKEPVMTVSVGEGGGAGGALMSFLSHAEITATSSKIVTKNFNCFIID
jgi:hypothetical protein